MAFAHLHTHTAYSLLDGEGTVKKTLDRAKELGQTAMAITDHGCMFGVIEFYEYAKSIGIKPVLGCEVYVAARTRFDKVHELDSSSAHLILLAKNNIGYKNLMKIVSAGYIEGFYYKPRIDMEVLRKNSEGIIAMSACMIGVLSKKLLSGDYEAAKKSALEFIDIFGKENYYIEIQDHGIYEQKKLNHDLIRLARELDLKLAATNDIHYVKQEDAEFQDVLMCIQMGKTIYDEDRMKMSTDQMYVKSEQEMQELFSYIPEAIENTQKIADMCNVEIEFGKLHLPKFDLPEGYTSESYLRELCAQGFEKRYPNAAEEICERLEYELKTIESMGYVDYFLIVWDFIHFARRSGIKVGPGRGSAAGSIVSYCLEITNIDPIKYDLIFERFLNPERVTMPDIDIDFCYERRGEVIDYVIERYGSDRVAQIVTFGTMAARLAIRDTGRALNMPYNFVDSVAKQIPNELNITIEKALKSNAQLKNMYDADVQVRRLIEFSSELEGLPRHTSTHAAGVVITRDPVQTYVPLSRNDNVITTQFTMTTIERLGLLKMDFLGLRTLTVIRDAAANIKHSCGIEIDTDKLDMTDSDTYEMISRGDTDGVFQLESGGMQDFMKELKPSTIEDIIAGISLYRPGPMDSIPQYIANKNRQGDIKYKHPLLEGILNVTYGCIVYQEQVMQIVRELGGYSLGRADLVRRAMSKKKTDVMEQERRNFVYGIVGEDGEVQVEGAVRRGIDEKTAISIFDEMMDFAKYAFNKSHAAAYAFVSYQTAWLKCHYPTEFYAAVLTSVLDKSTQVTKYINSAKKQGIKLLPPDINKSFGTFVPDGKNIRFGLAAIKNVGTAFVEDVVLERDKNGEFRSFADFCQRMAGKKLNKRIAEAMIRSGVFDSMEVKRSVLLSVYEAVVDSAASDLKNAVDGQLDLFGMLDDIPDVTDDFPDLPELPKRELLNSEKEYLGAYVSGHPLDGLEEEIALVSDTSILEILENENERFAPDSRVSLGGMIDKSRSQLTKRGEYMRYLSFEDLTGEIEVIVFPSQVRKFERLLEEGTLCVISGNLDIREDGATKIRLEKIELLADRMPPFNKLYIKIEKENEEILGRIKKVLKGRGGSIPVIIYCAETKQSKMAPRSMWVNDEKCVEPLADIVGDENVKTV